MISIHRTEMTLGCAGLVAVALLTPLAAFAQSAPSSYAASPDVYRVLEENDQFRVVLATWQPGQRDALHSHPASATYALTECDARLYGPDNRVAFEGRRSRGSAVLQLPVAAHSFENVGKSDCQILIVERK